MAKPGLRAGRGRFRASRKGTGPAAAAVQARPEEVRVMALTPNRTGNRLLDLLPEDEARRLLSSVQPVSLPHGQVVFQQGGPVPHVYFPTTSVFGIVLVVEEGKQVEGTTVGHEGIVGL